MDNFPYDKAHWATEPAKSPAAPHQLAGWYMTFREFLAYISTGSRDPRESLPSQSSEPTRPIFAMPPPSHQKAREHTMYEERLAVEGEAQQFGEPLRDYGSFGYPIAHPIYVRLEVYEKQRQDRRGYPQEERRRGPFDQWGHLRDDVGSDFFLRESSRPCRDPFPCYLAVKDDSPSHNESTDELLSAGEKPRRRMNCNQA
ncbi:hypothetical protein FZEAL_5081 [Fusarium zealandicum]|uniref:Uncharacterized protein n=1 Tax=Fusarium zealandicum TaxID=1053134 RepID=A0A8H4XK49_9HYPO|nr:hypothetical protein FZEAL_5081 [Fusarium zealandicum]